MLIKKFRIMVERKPLSKKIRFEVFKRDNFTCQYCGNKAPEFVLEVDHIKPVKEGGDNEIMNLVTSCFVCNRGKGARELKDNSIIEKQRLQIEELNIRRQQLEMILEWRDGLKFEKSKHYLKAIEYFNNLWCETILSNTGEKNIESLVDKYGLIKTLDTIDLSYSKYFNSENSENINFSAVFKKMGAILYLENKPEHVKQIALIKGIARNKFNYINEKILSIELNKAHKNNVSLDDLKDKLISNTWHNYSSFKEALLYFNDNANVINN